ncbi:unnamed protein product, partial [Vitis vinifera]
MDKTEPALVPEWLKSSGSVTGGGSTNHHFAPSLLQSDDGAALKPARKLMVNSNDHDTGRSSNLERTTSSYFRRSSSSNGSGHPRSFSSFGRTNREREWEKDIHDYRDKDKSQSVSASSVSVAPSTTSGLNMAETLVQGPARARANATPQLSVGTQRLEELALKQSRQLIPMTPSMPKTLVPSPSDKPKSKIGLQPLHLVNHSQRGGPARSDVTKTSNVGKLHVLKPSRERNGVSPTAKDSLSPTMGSRVANSPLAVTPSAAGSASLRSPRNNPTLASAERRPSVVLTSVEKRPTSQAQSRNDFFNLMRKKSSTNPPSAVPESGPANDRDDEIDNVNGDACDVSQRDQGDEVHDGNGDACDVSQKFLDNGEKHSSPDEVLYPDEEEAAFLRSLGWEENGEDEGLTEEEINAFYKECMKLKPSSNLLQRMLPKISPLLDSQMGSVAGAVSGLSSSDSELWFLLVHLKKEKEARNLFPFGYLLLWFVRLFDGLNYHVPFMFAYRAMEIEGEKQKAQSLLTIPHGP